MDLAPLTTSKQIRLAYSVLKRRLQSNGVRMKRNIGWPSGNADLPISWQPQYRFWSMLYPKPNFYWCGYGLQDPTAGGSLKFTVQINPPTTPINHRPAGVFLQDGKGRLYLGHNGGLTIGHASLGKTAFIAQYDGTLASVQWASGATDTFAVIGRLDEAGLLTNVARFIGAVAKFKRDQTGSSQLSETASDKMIFAPEFAGKKKSYKVRHAVESTNTHGYVVNELRRILKRDWTPFRTGLIDLYLFHADRITHIFEVKTDTGRGSVYQAIGQLMLHGALEGKSLKRIIVLPEPARKDTADRLASLGIAVLRYSWRGRTPIFKNLSDVLR
jgi:hypothetical protein